MLVGPLVAWWFSLVDLSSCPCCAVRCPAWALKASFGRRASFGAPSSEGGGTRVQRSFVHFIAPMGVRRTRVRAHPVEHVLAPHCIALLAPNHNLSTQACCEWAPGWVERWGGELGVSWGHLHPFFFFILPSVGWVGCGSKTKDVSWQTHALELVCCPQ